MKMKITILILSVVFSSLLITELQCRPQRSFVTTTIPASSLRNEVSSNEPQRPPKIVDVDIRSDVQFRYAKTVVKSYIKNPSVSKSQEVTFNMVLPDTAFISNFTIQLNGKDEIYVAKVAEKEEAKKSYDNAVKSGQSAGIVDADTRDANQITVRSNLEATGKMIFTLTYEEFLERHNSKYEHIIHVNPGQIIPKYNVNVYINESLPVTHLNVPELKVNPNEITSQLSANTFAKIDRNVDNNPNRAHIHFNPTPSDQTAMAKLSKNEKNGMSGQFIVQYDVDRKNQTNEIQGLDGYFVHFFAPDKLQVIPKHVVFVLDISGSMYGTKLQQTKDAMFTILDDMSDQDYFNILTFSDDVYHWTPEQLQPSVNNNPRTANLTYQGTDSLRKEALKYVLGLETVGGTNINDGLKEALSVIEKVHISESISFNVKPIIIFLTDGQATVGVTDSTVIKKNVINLNENLNVPIYGLAFGDGADFSLIKDISRENNAFARRIYEASDAPIQLEDFYQEIASPLLSNVTFDYVGESFHNKTNKEFSTFFKGGEYVIAGKLENTVEDNHVEIIVSGVGKSSTYKEIISRCVNYPDYVDYDDCCNQLYCDYKPHPCDRYIEPCIPWQIPSSPLPEPLLPVAREDKSDAENFIERLWAFLTIQNLLDEKENKNNIQEQDNNDEQESDTDKVLNLALKYNFVTTLTSLVVVKPDDETQNNQTVFNGTVVNLQPVSLTKEEYPSYGAPQQQYYSGIRAASIAVPSSSYGALSAYGAPLGTYPRSGGSPSQTILKSSPSYAFSYDYDDDYSDSYGSGSSYYDSDFSSDQSLVPKSVSYKPNNIAIRTTTLSTIRDEEDLKEEEESTRVVPDTTTGLQPTPHNCRLILFDRTLLRGQSVTLTPSNSSIITQGFSNLSSFSFDNKLVSFEVLGPCCWKLFKDDNFSGEYKVFSKGEYKSSTNLGAELAKEVSSVLMDDC
jgi:uncharacterized protein YegL